MLQILSEKESMLRLTQYQDVITQRPQRFAEICHIACDRLEGSCAAIAFLDEKKSWLPVYHGHYSDELPRESSLSTEVMEKKRTVVVSDVNLTTNIKRKKALKSCEILSYIAVPIILETQLIIGTFFIAFDHPKTFEAKDIFLMEGLSRLASSMLNISFLKMENSKKLAETKQLFEQVKTQQTKLNRNDKILKHVSKLAKIGGWEYDLINQSIHWSDQVYEIHEVMLGTTIELATALDFYEPESRAMVAQNLRHTIETGEPFEFECNVTTALGNIRNVRSIGEVELENNRVVRVFGTFQDITEQRTAEAHARQFLKMETLGHLTGEISHDFNNILSAIIANLQFYLKSREPWHNDHNEITDALKSAQRGVKLTNRLLDFARGKNLAVENFEPCSVVRGLFELMQEACGSKIKLALEFESDGGLVATDITLFETSLLNLVINARDASPKHSEITICVQNVGPKTAQNKYKITTIPTDYISISVTDKGTGMPEAVLNRITEPFFTTKEPGRGTGLGLSVVHNLITRSNGQLSIDSAEGKGTTVTMLLPRVEELVHH